MFAKTSGSLRLSSFAVSLLFTRGEKPYPHAKLTLLKARKSDVVKVASMSPIIDTTEVRHTMNATRLFLLPVSFAGPLREFHVSKEARDLYDLDSALFSLHGTVFVADLGAAQRVAHRLNERREVERFPQLAVTAGELYTAGLLDELLHLALQAYREQVNENVLSDAEAFLKERLGEQLPAALERFAELFPATPVYRGEQDAAGYLAGETDGVPHRHVVLEELLMLYLANENPALGRFLTLFDDAELETSTAYPQVIEGLDAFFARQPGLEEGVSLFETLRAPALNSPTSLEGQLVYLRRSWGPLLGTRFEGFLTRVLQASDVLAEEHKPGGFGGPGPARVLSFDTARADTSSTDLAEQGDVMAQRRRDRGDWSTRGAVGAARYSPDLAWMPRVVMLAKSTYVWLDQLSKRYGRDIRRLDQIPDEELDELARRGFTSLWLIGVWERSEASKRIKHLRGNPDAVASAYSLYDYAIAADLGGESAYENLRERTRQRGVRLASDMVPNHVGVDGRWVVEHPDWFLSVDEPPYPSYTFNGPDLSSDERVGIFIEDHYYDSSDAAVVFERLDRHTGDVRYVYHGNDGTATPWNDTAQLNYLNPETREGVIQTILHVARKFSVIRFDAAMTLAKMHIQRLWFPEPGEGGAIPSRAQYGSVSEETFNRLMPHEFWREVVDRVAEEVPDTLLLAEAFWMMEPYFVRTLGMHRVYNSAFMHMMMQEENAKYRLTIKNTLEFDREILKRFVNFMNNPDEDTAVAQFGKDDKYFGVCILMVTMPGLPMFGHGQVEGFAEKYGMEYRRAKLDESPDGWLIDRHYREVFPLLHRRAEFAEVENFLLYDLYTERGTVNENVFAYSNRYGDTASLVVYNNKFAQAKGWLKRSSAFMDKGSSELRQRDLNEGLNIHGDEKHFVRWREQISGLEYLKRSRDLQNEGLYVELEAFKYRVYLDIREVYDADGHLEELHNQLQGRGVPSLDEAVAELRYRPLYDKLDALFAADISDAETREALEALTEQATHYSIDFSDEARKTAANTFKTFLTSLEDFPVSPADSLSTSAGTVQTKTKPVEPVTRPVIEGRVVKRGLEEDEMEKGKVVKRSAEVTASDKLSRDQGELQAYLELAKDLKPFLRVWALARSLAAKGNLSTLTERLRLVPYLRQKGAGAELLELFTNQPPDKQDEVAAEPYLEGVLENSAALNHLQINEHAGQRWFNREAYRSLVTGWLGVQHLLASADKPPHELDVRGRLADFAAAEGRSGYRLDKLVQKPELGASTPAEETPAKALEEDKAGSQAREDAAEVGEEKAAVEK